MSTEMNDDFDPERQMTQAIRRPILGRPTLPFHLPPAPVGEEGNATPAGLPALSPPPPMMAPPSAPMFGPPPSAPTFGLLPQVPPPTAAPSHLQHSPAGTIGQQMAFVPRLSTDAPPSVRAATEAPVERRPPHTQRRLLELLWCVDDAEPRARCTALTAQGQAGDEAHRSSQHAVHRALAQLARVDDVERALWEAVDEDGVWTPPIVAVEGELELLFDVAQLVGALVPIARPFVDGDGTLDEELDRAAALAERTPDAAARVARQLSALRTTWRERGASVSIDELEDEARCLLLSKRALRTVEIFEAVRVVGLLHTEAHRDPLPVYLPESARHRLPLVSRFDARMFVELHPRQEAGERCPLAAVALAVARIVRP